MGLALPVSCLCRCQSVLGPPFVVPLPLPKWAYPSLQALVSFVGDCSDAALLEDVLCTLAALLRRDSLARLPLLACIQELGGPELFLSLVGAVAVGRCCFGGCVAAPC